MLELSYVVLSGIFVGLVAGLLPGLGSTAILLLALPVLYTLPPELCIIYYAVAIQSSQFSGSVSAINFGMMGELTSYPALMERQSILKNNLQKTALRFTALGSAIACIIPALSLYWLLEWFKDQHTIMRTDFIFGITLVIILFCLLYKSNKKIVNAILILLGIIISQVGLRNQGAAEREFLTFGQPWLYGGIPMISVLAGLIAVPLVIRYITWKENNDVIGISKVTETAPRFPFASVLRGGILGLFTGLLPAIGTQIGSNLAWYVEKKLKPSNSNQHVMARLVAAETANNGSQITVLVPLLIIGIAIVPSEMLLLSILETKFWMPGQNTFDILGLNFYQLIILSLITASIVSYLSCYTFLSLIYRFLKNNLILLNRLTLIIMTVAVVYSGSLVEARMFFLATFMAFAGLAIWLKNVDFIPFVAGYFIGDIFIDSWVILSYIYSN